MDDISQDDLGALRRKEAGLFRAHPRAAPENQRNLAIQSTHAMSPHLQAGLSVNNKARPKELRQGDH